MNEIRRAWRFAAFEQPLPGAVDIVDDSGGGSDDEEQPVGATKARALKVPGNVLPWIEDAADAEGMPRDLLAAVLYQHSRFSRLTPALVSQVAQQVAAAYDALPLGSHQYPGEEQVDNAALWLDAATTYAKGSLESPSAVAYRNELRNVYGGSDRLSFDKRGRPVVKGKAVGIELGPDVSLPTRSFVTPRFPGGLGGQKVSLGSGTAKQPTIPGLSEDAAYAVQRVADSLFIQYLGRVPTNEEYLTIAHAGWNADTTESWLRGQPHPSGGTVGEYDDVTAHARKSAQQWLGRDPDPGEVHYLVTRKFTSADQIDAYYNQLKQRHDTGDPTFAWVGDPDQWRSTDSTIEGLWKRAGMTGPVDPHLVNQAISGNWMTDDIQTAIDAMPAPGYDEGITIGQVNRIKPIAQSYKNSISHIHQGEALTHDEIKQFLGMSPLAIREYYRSLPAAGKGARPRESAPEGGGRAEPLASSAVIGQPRSSPAAP